jgi:hypothetical protein
MRDLLAVWRRLSDERRWLLADGFFGVGRQRRKVRYPNKCSDDLSKAFMAP